MVFLLCYSACAVSYLVLAGSIAVQAGRSRVAWLLCAASVSSAAWAVSTVVWGAAPQSPAAWIDLARAFIWYAAVLYLYWVAVGGRHQALVFTGLGVGAVALGAILAFGESWNSIGWAMSGGALLRLVLAIGQIMLLENIYRGSDKDLRWHVGLACVAMASLSLYELVMIGDAVLAHRLAPILVEGRAITAIIVAPLLAVAAARNRSWGVTLHASRTVVLHTATLMISGIFLISLSAVAELLRHVSWAPGSDWPGLLQVAFTFSGLLAISSLLISASARNWLARLLSEHFFSYRYDYRREWLRCIATLELDDAAGLPRRAIRAIANVVDSPAGLLMSRGQDQASLSWAGSWNLPAAAPIPPGHPLLVALGARDCLELPSDTLSLPPLAGLRLWLAVPLTDRMGEISGCILLAPPRGPFRLDDEVFSLLRVLAREVATHLGEQQATRKLMETRDLRVYSERFAFIAHDIKNVAGQLRLLTANAERHLANPAFQRDMLSTVEASVQKIGGLIRRLETAEADPRTAASLGISIDLLPRITALLDHRDRSGLHFDQPGGGDWRVCVAEADLQAVLTHLLDNATAAATSVHIAICEQPDLIVLDIVDDGPGMTPEFVRDELFRPFSTRTVGGSGIGAFQARELLRRARGDLLVLSKPGEGTTMRLLLPRPPREQPVMREAAA